MDSSFRQKIKNGIHHYWTTGDIEAKRKKQSDGNKRYWIIGNVQEKKKRHSQSQKNSYINNPKRKERIVERLKQRWNGINGELNRKKLSESLKNSQKKKQADKKIKDSKIYVLYNNPDFKKRWKPVYEQNMDVICQLLKHSNLPDNFIIYDMFNKKVHADRVLAYYKHIGVLPKEKYIQKKNYFLRFKNDNNKGHKIGLLKKTIFDCEIKYNFYFIYKDFFDQLKFLIKVVNDDKISDSMIINLQKYTKILPNYFQIIEYFQELGIINDVETILIRTDKVVGKKCFTVPAKKTKFKVNYKNFKNYLIDQEFNIYEINDNGELVSKGKFGLEINGKKYSLRCFR